MITQDDRQQYPYHTDASILGLKMVGGLNDGVLESICADFGSPFCEHIKALMDGGLEDHDTNTCWILGAVVNEAHLRNLIDDETANRLYTASG